ncbi:Trypsin family protein with PDZ domain [Zea mays]|nr:Trypsin family protein with PDZ domain [Zea mays]
MLLRVGRRAALLLAATAAFSRLRDPDTAVYVSASPPQPPRQAFSSSAAAEGLRSGTCLFSPYLLPYPFQGFPVLNTFTSASVSPANNGDQGSDGSSGDPRCCPACLGRNSIAKAASAVGPAVVNISSMHDMHGWVNEQSIGSGTIIDPDGTILTCAHVVADFQSTKAIVRRKVANLALHNPYMLTV